MSADLPAWRLTNLKEHQAAALKLVKRIRRQLDDALSKAGRTPLSERLLVSSKSAQIALNYYFALGLEGTEQQYRKWLRRIAGNFKKIEDEFAYSTKFKSGGADCCPKSEITKKHPYAFVTGITSGGRWRPEPRDTIYVCPPLFDEPVSFQKVTVIHEIAHKALRSGSELKYPLTTNSAIGHRTIQLVEDVEAYARTALLAELGRGKLDDDARKRGRAKPRCG